MMETGSIEAAKTNGNDVAVATALADAQQRDVGKQPTFRAETDAVRVDLSAQQVVADAQSDEARPEQDVSQAEQRDAAQKKEAAPSAEFLEESRQRFERAINSTELRFEVSQVESKSSKLFFQVVDRESGRVVRQFPPEKLIELAELPDTKLDGSGGLIDESA